MLPSMTRNSLAGHQISGGLHSTFPCELDTLLYFAHLGAQMKTPLEDKISGLLILTKLFYLEILPFFALV